MDTYDIQIVEHVNYVANIEAESQEAAEQLAIKDINNPAFDWVRMTGGSPCEVCLEDGDYESTDNLKAD